MVVTYCQIIAIDLKNFDSQLDISVFLKYLEYIEELNN